MGLTFEHTKLFAARCTETNLVKLWGSHGLKSAPMKDWKHYANSEQRTADSNMHQNAKVDSVLELETAIDEVGDDAFVSC